MALRLYRPRPGEYELLWLEVDPATVAVLDELHESADLFAWRETHLAVCEWYWARLWEVVRPVRHTSPISAVDYASVCDGVGLSDPEFGQWHIVTEPEV